ncbi:serine carboxypeptidase-like protein 5 [Elsinoe australis]|uniref:Carboxypeptidase n=1 Tax=Elsinoe australis TaxID=40998 RepID=A0A4U7B2B9_9PEZI|nr:serine carboxypeptidase-like protein 5 [Elsinoe australis]
MKVFTSLCLLSGVALSLARSSLHVNKELPARRSNFARPAPKQLHARQSYGGNSTIIPQNANTTKFAIDGTAIPDVDFDIGEAYGGLLPISNAPNASQLYFFFAPSANVNASDEITIWLNGGPGCSSLEGLLQENGPFLWQYGTFKPVANNYKWSNLTNMVWVEQPVGTGFTQGTPTATNEDEAAAQFLGFWKNFVDTFGLHNRKVFIVGESYAGYYVPYIANAMFNKNDTAYYGVDSIMIYDPSLTYDVVQEDLVATAYVDYFHNAFNLNATFMADIHNRSASCGYDDFLATYLSDGAFPPKGPLPTPPNVDFSRPECSLWNDIFSAVSLINPSFDIYQIFTTPPNLWDVLGFPGSFDYLPTGAEIYFNRTDVQKAINAPIQEWTECAGGVLRQDTSTPSALSVLPSVIERTQRTVIDHGLLDYILIANGSLLAIQNMTWNGAQGFSTPPSQFDEFYVPYHSELSLGDTAGAGVMGHYHTERGLTFVEIDLSGHMVPQYAPSAAYRHLEFLLGRVESLGERSPFSTQVGTGDFGN